MVEQRRNWKLTAGRLWQAWLEYPRQRGESASIPSGPPIFVTGTHRSGTTWVAKMLAIPGLWYVHEPFNPNKRIWPEPFTYANPDDSHPQVDRLMHRILRGGVRQALNIGNADHPWMPLRLFPSRFGRMMIKDPLACLLTGYLTRRFDTQTLVLFRHPCGFVSSVMRLGWPTGSLLAELLRRRQLMDEHLGRWAGLMEKHKNEDSIQAAGVLHGVLNCVLWNQVQSQVLRYELFEVLCSDPLSRFKELFQWFALPYNDEVISSHAHLCSGGPSSPADYQPHAVARDSSAMAGAWRQQLAIEEVIQIRKIWEEFRIPLYQDEQDWKSDCCRRRDFSQ